MKSQQKLWIRMLDSLLPKQEQKPRVIDRYRSRALVRTALMGSLLNPCLFLFESWPFTTFEKTLLVLSLILFPLFIIWLYRATGRIKFCTGLYVIYCTALCAYAQLTAGTVHAMWWIWVPFFIVFSVLVIGVKPGAVYTALTTALFIGIMKENARHGHVLGRYPDANTLLSNIALQILVIQVCFLMLMVAYDVIRNRAEVRAVLLRFTDEEAARLATVGERMGTMAQELQEQLTQFQKQLEQLDALAKRSDTKVEDVQTVIRELQTKTQALTDISHRAHG